MMTKTARRSRRASAPAHGSRQPLVQAAVDAVKRFSIIQVPRRAWVVGLGLTVGIILAAEGSASADDQSRSRNANVVDQLLAELGANPSTIARSSVPKCSSPAS
jgi:hypothetical protein